MLSDFETWKDEVFWPAMADKYNVSWSVDVESFRPSLSVEVSTPPSSTLRQDVREARVITARDLAAPVVPAKKHIESSCRARSLTTRGTTSQCCRSIPRRASTAPWPLLAALGRAHHHLGQQTHQPTHTC